MFQEWLANMTVYEITFSAITFTAGNEPGRTNTHQSYTPGPSANFVIPSLKMVYATANEFCFLLIVFQPMH